MEQTTEKQAQKQSKPKTEHLEPYQWKKGQSGNVLGRPKGKTMKEWARDFISRMTDEERDAWMEGLSKEKIWAMAEGNPETKNDLTSDGKPVQFIVAEVVANKNAINNNTHTETE